LAATATDLLSTAPYLSPESVQAHSQLIHASNPSQHLLCPSMPLPPQMRILPP